jgi:hypothetical protein
LEDVREIDIRDSFGVRTGDLLYQLREESGGVRWLFIAHADNPENPDLPQGDIIRIRVRGEWAADLYDTTSGEISPLPVTWQNGWTVITRAFYEHDSLLLKLDKSSPLQTGEAPKLLTGFRGMDGKTTLTIVPPSIRFPGSVPVTLEEPNVLLLDMAEFALDSASFRPVEEILRLDNVLRTELGWPTRSEALAQPWVEHDGSTPHTLKLRYTFESEIPVAGAELALENASASSVSLNGTAAGAVKGWYVDKCIGRVPLPGIKAGTNTLEVSMPYGRKVDVEAMYLLGDFGVKTAGAVCTMTRPVRALGFGDITRQGLPFYGGNLVYHLEAETQGPGLTIKATNYRGHLLKVKVDGRDCGPLVYSPYQMEIPGVGEGRHKIDLEYFGSRVNTFGQLHCVYRNPGFWWGPNSWRTLDSNWSYEYQFWPQGVLKSPEIG